jgi:hypothetical protein
MLKHFAQRTGRLPGWQSLDHGMDFVKYQT